MSVLVASAVQTARSEAVLMGTQSHGTYNVATHHRVTTTVASIWLLSSSTSRLLLQGSETEPVLVNRPVAGP